MRTSSRVHQFSAGFCLANAVLVAVAAAVLSGCVAEAAADGQQDEGADNLGTTGAKVPRTFASPRKGAHLTVNASPTLGCKLIVNRREYDFPAGAESPSVSTTGKTMCFTIGSDLFCHVSGTSTGFCADELNNIDNQLRQPPTEDGNFVMAYLRTHPKQGKITLSGHSQGAYDVSRAADRLGRGDQLFLLQPAASALLPNRALLDATKRGANIIVAWSPNDNASLTIQAVAGAVPLLTFPLQEGIRVHNAPNARDLFMQHFRFPENRSFNPALEASILSNPGSPRGSWRFPTWR
jgi:hypothetical protein